MLYAVDNHIEPITSIPYRRNYDRWMRALNALSRTAHDEIIAELDRKIDGTRVQTSSWMPGGAWAGTPFIAIYEACGHDETAAGLFFGLLVWETFMEREEAWSFGRYSVRNVTIRGLTYFRIHL